MKNYFIVGGSSGIGKALSHMLAGAGQQVYATYCNNPVQEEDESISYHFLDVEDKNTALDYLPKQLDGFVYCPGSINLAPFARIKPEDFASDFQLQVLGAITLLQTILPKLKAADQASIVFFSTVAVQTGFNYHTQVAASKGAIEGLTRSLAAELAPHIRVNAIAPSITETALATKLLNSEEKRKANAQRHPLRRIGNTEDIAAMAAFLLSEKASWMTGQIITIDGGISSLKI